MKVVIHRGTHQIGGCITEIESSKGTKIAIDIGENLPSGNRNKVTELKIQGLTEGEPKYNAVIITHYHGDHIGLYNKINPKIPIYIGSISKEIFRILVSRLVEAKINPKEDLDLVDKFRTYKIPDKLTIEDITITPIEVDHSAFNAHMLLIECDGKKLLHAGDFRLHGQRGKSVIPALERYVGLVDCLICEGTTLSRKKEQPMSEHELQKKAAHIFKENKFNFVMCSSTNIDRIAAIHKAALSANRLFVCDKYQKKILMYVDTVSTSSLYKFRNKVLSYGDNLLELMKEKGFVMLVRPNYISKKVMNEFTDNTFIYSLWDGYLDEKYKDDYEYIQNFVPEKHINLHTSGHADYEAIKLVCQVVSPKLLIPIHGENPEVFNDMRTKKLCN